MVYWPIIAAAAAASSVQPGSKVDQDLHCLAAFSLVGDSAKGEDKPSIMIIAMFYVGRLDAEAPGLDLEDALADVISAPGYRASSFQADIARCSAEMEAKAGELKKVGKALTDRGSKN